MLRQQGWIDTGLRGQERQSVLKAPDDYARRYAFRGYLGKPYALPYVWWRKLYDVDGQPVATVQPLCGYDSSPADCGEYLVFLRNQSCLVLRREEYYRFFGLDADGRKKSTTSAR